MGADEIEFGRFRLDVGRRALSCAGTPIRLGNRAMDILAILSSAKGAIVSKDELLTRVWPGLTVEENNLQVQISALRKALDQSTGGESHLVTVPGRGYRLVGFADVLRSPALPDKPSIVVLPFQNMSDDRTQDYFADGIVEDIITALCHIRWLFVIARNSSFAYKDHPVDVKQVARELGVRYVLEGGVRKAAQRVRITAQLIDATTGAHLWADHFDGSLEHIFDLQDQVTASVVGAISPTLQQAEIERASNKPTGSLDAYDYFLRGLASAHRVTRDATTEALRLFATAIERDPDFATPHGTAAFCYVVRKINGWMSNPAAPDIAEAARLARRAAELGKDDAVALSFGGLALGYVAGDLEGAISLIDRSLALNPNLATAWYASGTVRAFRGGEPDLAIEHLARAMRLSPLDPFMFTMQGVTAFAHFFAGRYDEASAWAERAFWQRPNILATLRISAVSNAYAGRLEEARTAVARALELDPEMRISNLKDRIGVFRRPEDYAKYAEGLRMAGLPE
jgi:TolB-like protein